MAVFLLKLQIIFIKFQEIILNTNIRNNNNAGI